MTFLKNKFAMTFVKVIDSPIKKTQKQIFIIGPTASGKSALAIELAKKFKGEIISSDSRQIYRGLNIGAGKEPGKLEEIYYTKNGDFEIGENVGVSHWLAPTKAYICEKIPHFMIDIAHPNTLYSVEKFVKKAEKIREKIWQRKNLPLICGGTMFWAQALVEKQQFPKVPPNEKLRQELSQKNSTELLEILKNLDLERAKDIIKKNEVNNLVRLIRAIEIVKTLGKVPKIENVGVSHRQTQNTLIISVSHPREILYEKIEKRMDQWFDDGIFEEIKKLHLEMRVSWKRLESFGLEYKWCSRFVQGKISFDEMRKNTIQDLKNYAKRQQTWIKRWEKSGTKIHHLTTILEAEKLIRKFLKKI